MLETTQQVTEGWYPDPMGRLWLRRWDGQSWTQETQGATPQAQLEYAGDTAHTRAFQSTPEVGWASVAFALHSALVSLEPVVVKVQVSPSSRILVSTLEHTYHWEGEPADMAELPPLPQNVPIAFGQGGIGTLAQGRSLDGLLWRISHTAFRGRLAPWLQDGDLYRMLRWPNLTTINPELDDMRQAAMLANGMFTIDELAGFSDRQYQPTLALINALSLMNTLKVAAPRDTAMMSPFAGAPAAMPTSQPAAKPSGLFQRLRQRLGL